MICKAYKRPGNKSIIVECDFSLPLLLAQSLSLYIYVSLVVFNIEKLYSKAFRDDNVLHLNLDRERERGGQEREDRGTHTRAHIERKKGIAVVSP